MLPRVAHTKYLNDALVVISDLQENGSLKSAVNRSSSSQSVDRKSSEKNLQPTELIWNLSQYNFHLQ